MDEDEPEEEQFDGYDMPGGAQGGNTGGAGGGQPPRGGNVAGEDEPGDSSSSSSDIDGSDASPPICENSLVVESATIVEKRRTSTIDIMRP